MWLIYLHIDTCFGANKPKTNYQDYDRQSMAKDPIYRVSFYNQGQVYEVYARQIFQSELMGFIEVEEFAFDERSGMIVDPGEEKLKSEFSNVKRSFIPMHSVVRIDEVEKQGTAKISDIKSGDKVAQLPFSNMAPKPKAGE